MIRKRTRRGVMFAALVLVAPPLVASGTANAADSLLSANKPTTVSSVEDSTFGGANAVDGDPTTRWASLEGVDPQWIAVDLGANATISKVKLTWEVAYASSYQIQTSANGTSWTTVKSLTSQNGGVDETSLSASGRYVRINGTKRGTPYGYSLWEFEVWGAIANGDTTPPSTPTGLTSTGSTSDSVGLQWTASTDNVGVSGYEILRNGAVVGTSPTPVFTDTGLASATAYTYTVKARDLAGNVSGASNAVQVTTQPGGPGETTTIVVVGDIVNRELPGVHTKTAALVQNINPKYIATLGDNQYDNGTIEEFRTYYDKTWGKFKSITKPSTGNHEWYDQLRGYKQYFGSIATPQGQTYYSWDVGEFHFVAVDSDPVTDGNYSTQLNWLKNDLRNTTKPCVVGYWHHPRFSAGHYPDNKTMAPIWDAFVDARADVVFNGHDHHYERLKPLNKTGNVDEANGVRMAIVGIGGDYLYDDLKTREGIEKIFAQHGVMKLTLSGRTYSWEIISTDGKVLDKAGPYTCR